MASKVTNVTIVTDDTNNLITLNAQILFGHAATTVFLLNHIALPPRTEDFTIALGGNKSLRHNTLVLTTSVMKRGNTGECQVDYTIQGALENEVTHSNEPFGNDAVVSHTIVYNFV